MVSFKILHVVWALCLFWITQSHAAPVNVTEEAAVSISGSGYNNVVYFTNW